MGVTHTFAPNTRARSGEVNQNFTDCEDGTAMDNMTNSPAMANNIPFYFKNVAGANDSSIKESTSDHLDINVATAGKDLNFQFVGNARCRMDSGASSFDVLAGWQSRAWDGGNTKAASFLHDGTDAHYRTSSGNLYLDTNADGAVQVFNRHPRRNHNTNTYVDSFFQSGWGYITGDGSTNISAGVTFPVAYSSDNIRVVVTYIGSKLVAGGAPTDESDLVVSAIYGHDMAADGLLTTGFTVNIDTTARGINLVNTANWGYSWEAVGPI